MKMVLAASQPIFIVAGRCLLASLFVLGGVNKIMNYADTLALMRGVGLEPAAVLLPATIALELGGGIVVALGWRWTALAALALAIFTLATNVVFHRFWMMDGTEAALQLSLFFKNMSIFGALLFVAGTAYGKPDQ